MISVMPTLGTICVCEISFLHDEHISLGSPEDVRDLGMTQIKHDEKEDHITTVRSSVEEQCLSTM